MTDVAERATYAGQVHDGSADDFVSVTPSDSATLIKHSRGIYVGVTGNLAVRSVRGTSVTFTAVPAGALLPIRVDQVLATGTTATSIVALF